MKQLISINIIYIKYRNQEDLSYCNLPVCVVETGKSWPLLDCNKTDQNKSNDTIFKKIIKKYLKFLLF